jgi:hypothetical protein
LPWATGACYDFFKLLRWIRVAVRRRVAVSNEGKEIKITDKRMFTPEGELREEYRFLNEKSTEGPAVAETPAAGAGATLPGRAPGAAEDAEPQAPGGRGGGGGSGRRREARQAPPAADEPSSRLELPGAPPGLGPSFYDLAAMLAEPVPIYLGDAELPDGGSAENLEMARLYIDLLDVLRQKTAGNLTAQEAVFLEDLLYRLRVRYVQKRG